MFGLGYQELLIILVIVLDALRRQPAAGAGQVAGLEREGVQEGRQRGQGRGHDRRLRRTARRRPSLSPPSVPRADPRSRCILHSRHARPCRPVGLRLRRGSLHPHRSLATAYRARMLYNWDAVQFALALGEYDVVKHQPHPPGYILYVALARLVQRLDRRRGGRLRDCWPSPSAGWRPSSSTCWRARCTTDRPRWPRRRCSR